MAYMVIGFKWDSDKRKIVRFIIGQFDKFYHAALFRDAYNKEFQSHAVVVETKRCIESCVEIPMH